MEHERKRFEETWARTAGLIETRFDQRVRQVFHRLQADLPPGLAHLDHEIDRLITGFLCLLLACASQPSSSFGRKYSVRAMALGAIA